MQTWDGLIYKSYSETIFLIKFTLDFTHVDVDDNKILDDDDDDMYGYDDDDDDDVYGDDVMGLFVNSLHFKMIGFIDLLTQINFNPDYLSEISSS